MLEWKHILEHLDNTNLIVSGLAALTWQVDPPPPKRVKGNVEDRLARHVADHSLLRQRFSSSGLVFTCTARTQAGKTNTEERKCDIERGY